MNYDYFYGLIKKSFAKQNLYVKTNQSNFIFRFSDPIFLHTLH